MDGNGEIMEFLKACLISFCAFVKSVFSDNGVGSFSRCGAGAVVFAVLAWISYVVLKTKAIPELQGPSLFMATGVGICYGTNKASEIVAAFKGK